MTHLDELAEQLGTSGRTLRRAAHAGTIRCAHRSPRRFEIDRGEREYVRRHWPLFAGMLQVLRTQPNVRLAVLFGSSSRGEERADSDVDLVVRFADPSVRGLSALTGRLEEETGRTVQVVDLESAEASPLLLAEVLRDGRVLVDRDGDWRRLEKRAREINAAAEAENERMGGGVVRLTARRGGENRGDAPSRDDLMRLPIDVRARLRDMPRHLRALQSILAGTDEDRYSNAARSTDADALTREVYPLERAFEIVSNYVVELAKSAVELLGVESQDAVQNLRRLGSEGAISRSRTEQLVDVHRMRNNLTHQYPDVRARLVFEAAEILEREVGPFLRSLTPWYIERLAAAD
jgi:predicted nucleotidyltransferase/uncharacterized protein YutE (UPF0331/DUF86 family)